MNEGQLDEREARAARNQSLFRAVNENIRKLNEAFASSMGDGFVIACECAERSCVEMLNIAADEYAAIRAEPRHFAVVPGHVYPDVEDVVREADEYVVVKKTGTGAELAEVLDERR